MKRAIIIVLDSAGIGELPDADKYGDTGSNTIVNIADKFDNLRLPNMGSLGLGNITEIKNVERQAQTIGAFGKMAELSAGKDTTTGHWELMGVTLKKPFPTYSNGFPEDVINEFEKLTDKKVIGNEVASGTEIIMRLGDEHVNTGSPIVYTSADSVFQIAAHEEVIPLEELYDMCRKARKMLTGSHSVGRVIARPFIGTSGNYTRTTNRRDFSLDPTGETLLDVLKGNGFEVKAVGKIEDIFNGKGITDAVHTKGNMDGVDKTIEYMKQDFKGIVFTNLVDFDMLYGHRNNVEGYGKALMDFDQRLPEIMGAMREEDILIITADHGCDPTTPSTDHSREYVPLLAYGKNIRPGYEIGTRSTFCDLAATLSEYFGFSQRFRGVSFINDLLK